MSGLDVAASVLILSGVALAVLAAIGVHRFDDVFARMHAATKPATLGLLLVIAGAALRMEAAGDVAKLLLVGVLQFLSAPVAAHMIGRAAYRAGEELSPETAVDELAPLTPGRAHGRIRTSARRDPRPGSPPAPGTGPGAPG